MASGGGFGSLDSFNKSLKNNQGLLKKVSAFENLKAHDSSPRYIGKDIKLTDKKLSKEELAELRKKTIRADRIHTFKSILKIALVIAVIGILLALLISGPLNKNGA